MTTQLSNFAFEEHLVRVVERNGEPWFVGVDVCRALDLSKPENALGTLDDDERYTLTKGVTDGHDGPNARTIVSEAGVYRLVFRSRKPEAQRFKRWLAHDVLPQIRRTGGYAPQGCHLNDDPRNDTIAVRMQLVREARTLYGKQRARDLWERLNLPEMAPLPVSQSALDREERVRDAYECLTHLLDALITPQGEFTIRNLLREALTGVRAANDQLIQSGVRLDGYQGFLVANRRNPRLHQIYAATVWANGEHRTALRCLPGAHAARSQRYGGAPSPGTYIPATLLDQIDE